MSRLSSRLSSRLGAVCALCLISELTPALAVAQTAGPALPTPEQIAQVVDIVATTSAELSDALARDVASARFCTLDASTSALRCEDVSAPGRCAAAWQPGLELRGLMSASEDGSTWWIGEAVVTDVGIVMSAVVWRSPRGEVMEAAGAMHSNGTLTLKEPRWFAASEHATAPPSAGCPQPPQAGTPLARATSATSSDAAAWRFDSLRVGPWPLGEPTRPHLGASGFLPPTLRTDGATVGAQGHYWLAPFTALTVFGDLTGRIGGGATLITSRRAASRSLDLAAVYDADAGTLRPLVVGDVSVGARRHLRGHLEHPLDEDAWRLRRLEHGGLFRDWRASTVGVALGGDGHALSADVGYVTDPEMLDPVLVGGLQYGSRFEASFTDWNVALNHETYRDGATVHDSTGAVDFGATLGSPGRAYVRPGAGVVANFGTVTARRGFDASTTLSVLATLEAGLAVEGRFDSARHRVAPRLRAGIEALGIQQRQAEEGAPPFAYQRPDRWRYAHLLLDQSVDQGGWSITLPAGIFADALSDETLGDAARGWRLHAALGARRGPASVQLQAACDEACSGARVGAFGRLRVRRGLTVAYGVSDLDAEALRLLYADALLDALGDAVLLVQPTRDAEAADADAQRLAQIAQIEVVAGPLLAQVRGRWAAHTDSGRGISARLDWTWPALGWGLGVGGGARLDGVWAATAGLTLR